MRFHILAFAVVAFVLPGCSSDTTIRCSTSADCLQGGIPGTCEPSTASAEHWCAFPDLSCAGSRERWGVASGDGLAGECVAADLQAVDAGVDAAAATCSPDVTECVGNGLEACDHTGHPLSLEACELGCISAGGGVKAHCSHIVPVESADACDQPALSAVLEVTGTDMVLDTDDGTVCNGGIITPVSGPALCVLRYGSFRLSASALLKVKGSRALAIVVDHQLSVAGVIDGSADGPTGGPGALATNAESGQAAGGSARFGGGGGGGFSTAGGSGGSTNGQATGGAGGKVVTEIDLALHGGFSGAPAASTGAPGGSGGGGVALVSCAGVVSVTGTVDVGGGGGSHGEVGGQLPPSGGAGGGTGGMLRIEGARVTISGGLYSNGGGGGSGNCGPSGGDGSRSTSDQGTGGFVSGCPYGGDGGGHTQIALAGGDGEYPTKTSGGGGGATGRLFILTPAGSTPDTTQARTSPSLEQVRTVSTR